MEKSQSAATAWQEKFISSSDKKKVQRNKDMAQIYIAFVDTPGFFAGMIRQVIKQKYIHVVLSMDAADRKTGYPHKTCAPAVLPPTVSILSSET